VRVEGVSFVRKRAEVVYDPAKASLADMRRALDRYGFRARPESAP